MSEKKVTKKTTTTKNTKPKVQNELDENLLVEAVRGLLAFEAKKSVNENESKLLDNYAKPILLQIQLKQPVRTPAMRPIRIKIPHTLFDPTPQGEEHTICLFCRSADKEILQTELDLHPIPGLTKILGLDEIKKSYKQFQTRKKLFKEYTHFLCDDRIFSHVINLLGKVFTSRNNHPIPIDVSNIRKLESSVDRAVNQSTYMHPSGALLTIRFGMTNMSSKKILENIVEGLKVVFEKLQFGLGSLNSIHLKSSDSPALPIHYSHQNEISEFLKKTVESKTEGKGGKGKNNKKNKKTVGTPTETPPPPETVAGGSKKKNKKSPAGDADASPVVIETIKPFSAPASPAPPVVAAEGKKTKKKGPASKPAPTPPPSPVAAPAIVAPPTPEPVSVPASKGANKKNKKAVTPVTAPAPAPPSPVATPVPGKKKTRAAEPAPIASPAPVSVTAPPSPSVEKKIPNKKQKNNVAAPVPAVVEAVVAPVTGKKRSKGSVTTAAEEAPVPVTGSTAAKKSKLRK